MEQLSAAELLQRQQQQNMLDNLNRANDTLVSRMGMAADFLTLPRVARSLFEREFLPFLLGLEKPTPQRNLNYNWLALGLYPGSPFAVVDDQTNEDLFIMPALYDSSVLKVATSTNPKDSMSYLVSNYQAYEAHGRGNAFLSQNMGRALAGVGVTQEAPQNTESLRQLREIFQRYAHLIPGAAAPTPQPTAAAQQGVDWIDYGD